MSDILISYASEDRPVAGRLARALESRGWTVWWDRNIPAGKTFDEVLEAAIAAAECIVVLWSEKSVASRWVRSEAEEGAARGILVPVLIEAVEIPLAFRRIQAADLVGWRGGEAEEALERLVGDLEEILGPPTVPSEAHSPAAPEGEPLAEVDEAAKPGRLSPRRIAMLALVAVAVIVGAVTVTTISDRWAVEANQPAAPDQPKPVVEPKTWVDATVWTDGPKWFFRGSQYYGMRDGKISKSYYPREIKAGWEGLPDHWEGVDAAFYIGKDDNQKRLIYLFYGEEYVLTRDAVVVDPGYPRNIKEGWGLPWRQIDAACISGDYAYFFKDRYYVRLKRPSGKIWGPFGSDQGLTQLPGYFAESEDIDGIDRIMQGIDAATCEQGETLLFKADEFFSMEDQAVLRLPGRFGDLPEPR